MTLSAQTADGPRMRPSLFHFGLLIGVAAAAGCSGSAHGKIAGRVLLDGAPLPGGTVLFRPLDGRANLVRAELDEMGAFSAVLPAGAVMVSVDNRAFAPKPPPPPRPVPSGITPEVREMLHLSRSAPTAPSRAAPDGRGRYVAIPPKYYSPESSGLGFTVESGDQAHDLELSAK